MTGVTRPATGPADAQVNRGRTMFSVSRWLLAALGVAVAGAIVAFLVVPYGPRDCPGVGDCNYVGWGPRMLTLIITAIIVLGLLTAAIVDSAKDR
jgi:hypothetical protein